MRISTVVTSPMLIHPYKLTDQPWSEQSHNSATVNLRISNTAPSGSGVPQIVCDLSLIEKSLYNGSDSQELSVILMIRLICPCTFKMQQKQLREKSDLKSP